MLSSSLDSVPPLNEGRGSIDIGAVVNKSFSEHYIARNGRSLKSRDPSMNGGLSIDVSAVIEKELH
ncbi:hypothetical protein NW754_014791 [Fusarium falciforme]|nr:hypothetical protein NW754_014791 [Fusarium falciforme]